MSTIDDLCGLIADAQDKYWNGPAFHPQNDTELRVSLCMSSEIRGMTLALAVAMGMPPEEGHWEGKADAFQLEWREKNGRDEP